MRLFHRPPAVAGGGRPPLVLLTLFSVLVACGPESGRNPDHPRNRPRPLDAGTGSPARGGSGGSAAPAPSGGSGGAPRTGGAPAPAQSGGAPGPAQSGGSGGVSSSVDDAGAARDGGPQDTAPAVTRMDAAAPPVDAPPAAMNPLSPILPVVFLDVPGSTASTTSTMPPPIGFSKLPGRMKIFVEHDGKLASPMGLKAGTPATDVPIAVSRRGSSSSFFLQLSFSVEVQDGAGQEVKTSILGMPPEADWALVACWNDRTCMRNALAYEMGRAMGRWAPRTRWVEVYFNDSYRGLYLLTEVPRQDKSRVPIPKPAPDGATGADALSGGYIFRREAGGKASPTTMPPRDWLSPVTDLAGRHQLVYTYHYPNEANITAAQRDYLQKYVASFEQAVKAASWADPQAGYRSWIDLDTFAEYFLMSELTNNLDGFWKSMYMVKLPDVAGVRGKLLMTPLWDYNAGFGWADFRDGWKIDNWVHKQNRLFGECSAFRPVPAGCMSCEYYNAACHNIPFVPFWWERIAGDKAFQHHAKCTWQKYRKAGQPFALDFIDKAIAGWKGVLRPNIGRHFTKWLETRKKTWANPCVWDEMTMSFTANSTFKVTGLPDPNCGAPSLSNEAFFDYEVNWLREWAKARFEWMDRNLPGSCATP